MELREITNKEEWENFLLQCAEKTFLQSWNWGEFNEKMGAKIWRFGAYNGERLISVALVIRVSARRGTFLFIPHGPIVMGELLAKDKKEILELMLVELSRIAKEEKALGRSPTGEPSFIRVSPIFSNSKENEDIFIDLGFRQAPIHMHPEATWELNITLPEEKLLMDMRKTTRYLIRQVEKNPDIEISISDKIEDFKFFWPVYLETAKRHGFVVFSEKYLEAEVNSFANNKELLIFLGKYKGQVVSTAIFIFWQGTCFYHHSGSLSKFSAGVPSGSGFAFGGNKIPVSYLLQWRAIQEAKNKGCRAYNFWGIAPGIETEEDAQKSRHPWAGLSFFKMGFGGYKKDYVKTQDFVISNKYWINYIIESLRKRKRNL